MQAKRQPKFYRRYDYDKSLLPHRYLASLKEGVSDLEEAKWRPGFSIGYPDWNHLYYTTLTCLRESEFNLIIERSDKLLVLYGHSRSGPNGQRLRGNRSARRDKRR